MKDYFPAIVAVIVIFAILIGIGTHITTEEIQEVKQLQIKSDSTIILKLDNVLYKLQKVDTVQN